MGIGLDISLSFVYLLLAFCFSFTQVLNFLPVDASSFQLIDILISSVV